MCQGDKAWLRDHRGRPEARKGRGRPRVGEGGGALVHRAHRAAKKKELTDEQLAAKAASRKAKKNRQKERRAKEAGERAAASEAERAERPRAQLRANIEYVMDGLRSAAARARSKAGSKTRVTYSLPPERDDGYRRGPSVVCATVPQGTVATTVASDWLANELAEHGEIDARKL